MAFEHLAQHVAALGDIQPGSPFGPEQQRALEARVGVPIPEALAWFWSTYGLGAKLEAPIVYFEPRAKEDVVLGWLLTPAELDDALESAESLAPRRIPIADDGASNLYVVDADGSVHMHLHDAPLDRNSYRIADSFEQFVLSWRRGE